MNTLSPKQNKLAQDLFHGALEQPEAARKSWLTAACSRDTAVFDLVLNLLEIDQLPEASFAPASQLIQSLEQPDLHIGNQLGPYRICGFIGAGGMGQVFKAERTDGVVSQQVAIKLLRFSASAEELKRRFTIERRILAHLNHPGIARFLDAGSDDQNRPFVVMELVDGVPITQYCVEHKLSLKQRLELFTKVLDAVSYAHQQLIVHRDLKPGNILVDRSGQPKLLDFGIAKPLSDIDDALRADGHTETTMRAYSVKYAAPEQLRGDPVGPGVDVYALGGVLYELLTGSTPLNLKELNLLQAQQQIQNQIPELASQRLQRLCEQKGGESAERVVVAALLGDLDRIIAHALKKEAHERYLSVDQFSADLSHYLRHEPISLRSSITSYRFRKFVQRYKLPVALASALIVGMVGSSIALLIQQQSLKTERDTAVREQQKAQQVSALLLQAFDAADPAKTNGKQVTAREVLDQAVKSLAQQSLSAEVAAPLATSILQVYSSLGLYKESVPVREQLHQFVKALPNDLMKLRALQMLAKVENSAGEVAQRNSSIELAGALLNSMALKDSAYQVEQLILEGITRQGRLAPEELALAKEAVAIAERSGDVKAQLNAAQYLISVYSLQKQYELALATTRGIPRAFFLDNPRIEIEMRNKSVWFLRRMKMFDEALAELDLIKTRVRDLYGADHPYFSSLFNSESNIYSSLNKPVQALKFSESALAVALQHSPSGKSPEIMVLYGNLAEAQMANGLNASALENASTAVQLAKLLLPDQTDMTAYMLDIYARALALNEKYADSLHVGLDVINRFETLNPSAPIGPGRIGAICAVAESYIALGKKEEAATWFARIRELYSDAAISILSKRRLQRVQTCLETNLCPQLTK